MEINTPLYKIAHDIIKAFDAATPVDDSGTVIMESERWMEVESLYATFDAKAEACAAAMKEFDAKATAAMDEANRLSERARVLKKRSEWIKEYLRQNMIDTGTDKVVGDLFTISLRKTPDKVNVEDPAKLPGEYLSATIDCEGTDLSVIFDALGSIPGTVILKPLKKDILAAVNAGQTFDGVTVTSGKTLVVK